MQFWNLFSWIFSILLLNTSSPKPIEPSDGGDTYTTTHAFGIDGFVDLRNSIDDFTRIDGEAGEAYFGENPSEIVDFVDQVLELLVSLHDEGLTHGNLIEEYIMRNTRTCKYYFVGFQEGQMVRYPPNASGAPSSDASFAYLAYRYDVGCIGAIFEKMFATKHPNTGFLRPLYKTMTDRNKSRRPSARQAYNLWLGIKAQAFN